MKTAAFILFAVVTAAVAALSTLTATRYLSLEKELSDTRSRLEDALTERKRQEEEKIVLRLERERVQSDLEARLAEQLSRVEACEGKRQQELLEIEATLKILQKAVIDIQVHVGPSARQDQGAAAPPAPQAPGEPARATDVPRGAIPTPEQEAARLDKAQ